MRQARDAIVTGRIVDCHAHLIDPARYPFVADGPGYRPTAAETGTCEDFCATLDAHGVGHAVLVQLSGYGTDNTILTDAMRLHPRRFRVVAVVAAETPEAELEKLAMAGVVGIRFNLVSYAADHLFRPETTRLLARMKALGWFAQVFAADHQWAKAAEVLRRSGVRVLVDHYGVREPGAASGEGFAAVMALARDGVAAVKLSAPFRIAHEAGYSDLDRLVETLLRQVGPSGLLWGSDWPFPDVRPRPDYADTLAPLSRWLASRDERDAVLWDTPARLFGFAETGP